VGFYKSSNKQCCELRTPLTLKLQPTMSYAANNSKLWRYLRFLFPNRRVVPTVAQTIASRILSADCVDEVVDYIDYDDYIDQEALSDALGEKTLDGKMVDAVRNELVASVVKDKPSRGRVARHSRAPFVKSVVNEIRLEFPFIGTEDNTANRMAIHRRVVKLLQAKKLRTSDIVRDTPLIVEMCFVPMSYDQEARDVANAESVRQALDQYNARLIGSWWDHFLPSWMLERQRGGVASAH